MSPPPDPPARDLPPAPDARDLAATLPLGPPRHPSAPPPGDLAQECARLRSALERNQQDLERFASILHHDLKKPLRGIDNLSRWIEDDLGDAVTPEAHEQMDSLRDRVRRLGFLIDGAVAYVRSSRPTAPEPLDLADLLRHVVDQLSPAPPAAVSLGPLGHLVAERSALQQVLLQLLGNALRHAGRPDVLVEVASETRDGFVHLTVSDNGAGIPPAQQPRIWDIFHTVDRSPPPERPGVGLAVVKRIVESRGGRLGLDSSEGQGATFHVWWPEAPLPA